MSAAPVRLAMAKPPEHEDSAEAALEKKLGPHGVLAATAPPKSPTIDRLIPRLLSEGARANLIGPASAGKATQRRPDQPVSDPAKAKRDRALAKTICAAVDRKNAQSHDLVAACKDLHFKKAGKQ